MVKSKPLEVSIKLEDPSEEEGDEVEREECEREM